MMGVVFALSGTLGTDGGLYPAALELFLSELTQERSIRTNGRDLEALVGRIGPALERDPGSLQEIVELVHPEAMSGLTVMARFRVTALGLVSRYFTPFEDVAATLAELRGLRVPQAALTEGWSGVDHAKAHHAGFTGTVIPAEEIPGGDGRSLSAFAFVARTLQLPADRLWFVGSDPRRDIAPARAAGFQTVWLNRDRTVYPAGVAQPDHTIRALHEFLGIISEPYMKSALTLREILGKTLEFRLGHVVPTDPLRKE
jgi:FMN phosphatase YigB (HAD superfamily)